VVVTCSVNHLQSGRQKVMEVPSLLCGARDLAALAGESQRWSAEGFQLCTEIQAHRKRRSALHAFNGDLKG
jgi:hypothetical protein